MHIVTPLVLGEATVKGKGKGSSAQAARAKATSRFDSPLLLHIISGVSEPNCVPPSLSWTCLGVAARKDAHVDPPTSESQGWYRTVCMHM